MSDYAALKITDFDHIEFAVPDIEEAKDVYLRMGFESAGTGIIRSRQLSRELMRQGNIKILLSQSDAQDDPVAKFVAAHGAGVINVAFLCEDAVSALETVMSRGAEVTETPKAYSRDFGEVQQASIQGLGDVQFSFVSRKGDLFGEGFEQPLKKSSAPLNLTRIDHISFALESGEHSQSEERCLALFGLTSVPVSSPPHSTLSLTLLRSPDGVAKITLQEPGPDAPEVQNFLEINHGTGVHRIGLLSGHLISTLEKLKKEGLTLWRIPEGKFTRDSTFVIEEDLKTLQSAGIFVDGDENGYLLESRTEPVVGPLAFGFIQRKGFDGLSRVDTHP